MINATIIYNTVVVVVVVVVLERGNGAARSRGRNGDDFNKKT